MSKKYESFEEWKTDFDRYTESPNDKHLLAYVVECIKQSSAKIQKQIKEYLMNSSLVSNPWRVFNQVKKDNPNFKVHVKNKEDPWFEA